MTTACARVLWAVAFVSVTAASAATTVFGPQTYSVATGGPQLFTVSLPIDSATRCDGKAVYILVSDSAGVSSATIDVNGSTILRESDFRGGTQTLERFITLADQNSLQVQLKGGSPGATLTLQIRKEIENQAGAGSEFVLTARQQTFRATISLSPGVNTPYVLMVSNGRPDGTGRVQSASISINGSQLLNDSSFAGVSFARLNTSLSGEAVIVADLRGTEGDVVSIALKRPGDESACGAARVFIDSPAGGDRVDGAAIFVAGRATGTRSVGVSVNGVPADLDLAHAGTTEDPFRWVAELSAPAGPLTLAAAIQSNGGPGTGAEVVVQVEDLSDAPPLRLIATPSSEIAPAQVAFRVENAPATITRFQADLDGDGTFEIDGAAIPGLSKSYDMAGLRRVTIRVSTATTVPVTAMAWVTIHDLGTLDVLLQARWTAFRTAARNGDQAGVLGSLTGRARGKYGPILAKLAPHLPGIGAELPDIELVYIRPAFAKYLLTRLEGGELAGYYVYFQPDGDGMWRIAQF